ncbi:tRNA (adenosine(37)-N6)-threonylcarbamoyltransferase complex ATPase subunit type 1 TsaE [Euzebyella marina]|uniref:tRNA threonylcarbamoyladenosine biosynthesis protein TsaE n=1 Tax=Euzebyella marina TaxID=1761453 RepID=A0A3G2L749_9FLAO|nr:tRNA (adenosine(37)-N6)-threonylcarbamoyltransferase complex ATPase subunit type 1 TsaE [Euzebyella marina]AYN68013.1 tRNA (adenosine(37)-N6)-threonylcarbamoyltransferase complex ATPase subunit type 1 TsaE [Euzebyella marina]MBG48184.1 tRNA (adenosine(37)-N6)-threonylcarbamoyltransferase complex ATPase subunit type 1 TsaE [Pseudozobellia sp.]|tara:strand:- start:494498 stop:494908 length:411 start_codon:yes stop_codon:yes gene_type:complete
MELIYKEEDLELVAKKVLKELKSNVVLFYAPMGAGKTTLIKALVKQLGGTDSGSSPTFGIVNEYHDKQGKQLAYHFDFYRLNDEMEALDLGLEDYLSQPGFVFIEWPEKIPTLISSDYQKLKIEILDFHTRKLHLA